MHGASFILGAIAGLAALSTALPDNRRQAKAIGTANVPAPPETMHMCDQGCHTCCETTHCDMSEACKVPVWRALWYDCCPLTPITEADGTIKYINANGTEVKIIA